MRRSPAVWRSATFPAEGVEEQLLHRRWRRSSGPQWAEDYRRNIAELRRTADQKDREVAVSRLFHHQAVARSPQALNTAFHYGNRPIALYNWAPDDLHCRDVCKTDAVDQSSETEAGSKPDSNVATVGMGAVSSLGEATRWVAVPISTNNYSIFRAMSMLKRSFDPPLSLTAISVPQPHPIESVSTTTVFLRLTSGQEAQMRSSFAGRSFDVAGGAKCFVGQPLLCAGGEASTGSPQPTPELIRPSSVEYRLLLRGLNTKTAMGTFLSTASAVGEKGFINYTAPHRFGAHTSLAYNCARSVLHRDYITALVTYCELLGADCSPQVVGALRRLRETVLGVREGHTQALNWSSCAEEIALALNRSSDWAKNYRNGFPISNLRALRGTLEAITAMVQRGRHNGAEILREVLGERVIKMLLRSLADVAWNAVASLRLELYGNKVVVGDVVCTDRALTWDSPAPPHDYLPLSPSLWDSEEYERAALRRLAPSLRVIESEADAKRFDLSDVVLPKPGRESESVALFPSHKCGTTAYDMVLRSLQIPGLLDLSHAPLATYRRLMVKPIDDLATGCGYAVECWDDSKGFHLAHHGACVSDVDGFEGVGTLIGAHGERRLKIRASCGLEQPKSVRPSILPENRRRFVEVANPGGLIVGVKVVLPPGAALQCFLREFVVAQNLTPGRLSAFMGFPIGQKARRESSGSAPPVDTSSIV